MKKESNHTFLVRNIPRKDWKGLRIKCFDIPMSVNDLMLKLIDDFSKGKIDVT